MAEAQGCLGGDGAGAFMIWVMRFAGQEFTGMGGGAISSDGGVFLLAGGGHGFHSGLQN